jgi:hypothetical protein
MNDKDFNELIAYKKAKPNMRIHIFSMVNGFPFYENIMGDDYGFTSNKSKALNFDTIYNAAAQARRIESDTGVEMAVELFEPI